MNDLLRKLVVTGFLASNPAAEVRWWLAGGLIYPGNVVGVWRAIGAASLAASYVNLANPGTYNLTTSAAPTWASASGWSFDGSTKFLNTGVVPGENYTIICRFAGATLSRRCMGEHAASTIFGLMPISGSGRRYTWAGASADFGVDSASGVMALAGAKGYFNGAYDGQVSSIWSGGPPVNLFIGASTINGSSPINMWAGTIQAAAVYNVALSSTQIDALTTSVLLLTG